MKDAVGSPFGKADRLCLYLHVQKLCVEWKGNNTGWHIKIPVKFMVRRIATRLHCEAADRRLSM